MHLLTSNYAICLVVSQECAFVRAESVLVDYDTPVADREFKELELARLSTSVTKLEQSSQHAIAPLELQTKFSGDSVVFLVVLIFCMMFSGLPKAAMQIITGNDAQSRSFLPKLFHRERCLFLP